MLYIVSCAFSFTIYLLDKHEIISDIKRVASELGHQPSRKQYLEHGKTGYSYETAFGTWTDALIATFGTLENTKKTKEKSYTPLEPVINHHKDNQLMNVYPMDGDIVIVGDTHFPFVDLDALTFVYWVIDLIKPKYVVQIGDLKDMYAQAKFPRSHNSYSPKEEDELGSKMAAQMWSKIQSIVPEARCIQLFGNHDSRAYKRMMEQAPTLEHLIDFKKYMTFENVHLVEDPREELMIGDVVFTHGWLSQIGAHRDYLMKNVCVGHSHTGGVSFKNVGGKIIWELNAGYLGDPMSKALSYTPTKTTRWTQGVGLITALGPMFIPKP